MKNFYKILNISENSSPEEIKKAYRNLAKIYHPDNKETGNAEKFREIQEAYDNLINPKPQQERYQEYNPFADFFGFNFVNADIYAQVYLTLEEAFNGASRTVLANNEKITIDIPKGVYPNQTIIKQGKGKVIRMGKRSKIGDLVIQINIQRDDKYFFYPDKTIGQLALLQSIDVDMFTALLGGEIVIDNIDKTKIKVTIPQGFKEEQLLKIPNKGWRFVSTDKRTDLYLKLHIKNRIYNFSEDEVKALEGMRRKYDK